MQPFSWHTTNTDFRIASTENSRTKMTTMYTQFNGKIKRTEDTECKRDGEADWRRKYMIIDIIVETGELWNYLDSSFNFICIISFDRNLFCVPLLAMSCYFNREHCVYSIILCFFLLSLSLSLSLSFCYFCFVVW